MDTRSSHEIDGITRTHSSPLHQKKMCWQHHDSSGQEYPSSREYNRVPSDSNAPLRQVAQSNDLQICYQRHPQNEQTPSKQQNQSTTESFHLQLHPQT